MDLSYPIQYFLGLIAKFPSACEGLNLNIIHVRSHQLPDNVFPDERRPKHKIKTKTKTNNNSHSANSNHSTGHLTGGHLLPLPPTNTGKKRSSSSSMDHTNDHPKCARI